jgi:hypothetical protein
MIALDANILVYAHRRDSDFHASAHPLVQGLAEGRGAWAIPWPCVHEFFAVVTHPKIYGPPSTREQAIGQLNAWFGSPSLNLISEPAGYWEHLRSLLDSGKVAGPMVHDARIAALCAAHGVRELWSADRDFSRFSSAIRVKNPLVD